MRSMKRVKWIVMIIGLILASILSKAQTATTEITDEDLKKYAMTMDSVQVMQQTLTQIITENVQQNEVMSVARYNELYKLANDETKLKSSNATAAEIDFVKEIAALREYNIGRINSTYQALAKEFVGLKAFNAIRKSLETDTALKTRYENVNKELSNTTSPSSSDSKGR